MKDIRLGNDIHISWVLTGNVDLSDATVTLHDLYGRSVPVEYSIESNTVTADYYGKDQKTTGIYRLLLQKNAGEVGMVTIDKVEAFKLYGVCDFGIVRGEDNDHVTTVTVELESDLTTSTETEGGGGLDPSNYYTKAQTYSRTQADEKFATKEELEEIEGAEGADGKSAYEVAVDNGFVGTEQEWLSSLKGETGERGAQGERGETGAAGTTDYNELENKPTIPTVPTNVSDFTNDAGYLTQHQDISGKEDRVQVEGIPSGTTTLSPEVGRYYNIAGSVTNLAVTLPSVTDRYHLSSIVLMLTTGASPSVAFTAASGINVIAQDGFSIEADTTYEVNAIFNGSAWILAAIKLDTTDIQPSNS